jgi:hypothetical protein
MPRTGRGRIFQRGETWWIDYSFRGKRYRESSENTKSSVRPQNGSRSRTCAR